MDDKELLKQAFEIIKKHCGKRVFCPSCELRLTCCKHVKTRMHSLCLEAQLELEGVKND